MDWEDRAYICPCCGNIQKEDYECKKCGSGVDVARKCEICLEYKTDTKYDYDNDVWVCETCKETEQ